MADTISPERRSLNMSAIKSKDTKPEVYLRKLLYHQGFITERTTLVFSVILTSIFRNIRLPSSFMAVTGIGTADASTLICRKAALSSGKRSLMTTFAETSSFRKRLKTREPAALLSGNAPSRRCKKIARLKKKNYLLCVNPFFSQK